LETNAELLVEHVEQLWSLVAVKSGVGRNTTICLGR